MPLGQPSVAIGLSTAGPSSAKLNALGPDAGTGVLASRDDHLHVQSFYDSLNTTQYTVTAGAPGWVDVDLSALITDAAYKVIFCSLQCGTAEVSGIRRNGETATPTRNLIVGGVEVAALSGTDPNRIVEVLRNATNDVYLYVRGVFR